MKFKKLVAIEPINLIESAEEELNNFAEEVKMYRDIPKNAGEIVSRIDDADAVLLNYTSKLGPEVMESCPNIDYIGMCCSLYSPESANVDIKFADSKGITVTGIRDYGDEGVVEYVISELISCLHGFGRNLDGSRERPWDATPREITGIKVGIVGLGKSGGMVAGALHFFGADISYVARSEKKWAREKGYRFMPLKQLLRESEVVITCLNKNVILMHETEFEHFGNGKILFNTGLSPAWDEKPFARWLEGDNRLFCDTLDALGSERFLNHRNVRCPEIPAGRTRLAFERLSKKVLANIETYIKKR